MKTPREILLERHRSANPKLDGIRRNVLPQNAPIGTRFLRELLLPLRWHLAGMSAVWVVVALFNAGQVSPVAIAADDSSSRQLLIALAENRRQLAEMIEPAAAEFPSPAQRSVPRRRSDVQLTCAIV